MARSVKRVGPVGAVRTVRVNCAIYTRQPAKPHQTSRSSGPGWRLAGEAATLNIKRVGRWFDDHPSPTMSIHHADVAGTSKGLQKQRTRRNLWTARVRADLTTWCAFLLLVPTCCTFNCRLVKRGLTAPHHGLWHTSVATKVASTPRLHH